MFRLPPPGRGTRFIGLLFGFVLLFWMSVEDNQVWPAALLGAGLSALVVGLNLLKRWGGRIVPTRLAVPGAVIVGALVGLGASLLTGGLMVFKNALHGHVYLDFPPGLVLAVLERAPVWSLAGGLVGLGLLLLWMVLAKND